MKDEVNASWRAKRDYRTPNSSFIPHPSSFSDHHVYRKRIRGVRTRWFASGLAAGVIAGVFLTVLLSALAAPTLPAVVQNPTGEPDVAVVIGEAYLNREAANRIASGEISLGESVLSLESLNIDLKPDNRMGLQPTFAANLGITLEASPAILNQLSIQNGQLAINMVGDPQLGDLSIPLEFLPFDLNAQIREAVDNINNDLLISEINQSLQSGFGGSDFLVEGVTTNETSLTIRLQQR